MTMSITFQEQSQNLIVVIRTAGERTLAACKSLLLDQIPERCVHVVSEKPFEATLRKTYEIGIESGDKWLMTLDADVFLRENAVSKLMTEAEVLPGYYFQIEGLVHDKLTGLYRKAGHRMYRTKYLKAALKHIPADNIEVRPEYSTLQKMGAIGFPSMEINSVFGVHDYEQYYRDIYRKAFVHANKHLVWLPRLVSRWKKLAANDDDFHIALRGLYDGLISLTDAKIDTRDYTEAAECAMGDLGLQEKPSLPDKEVDLKHVQSIIDAAGQPPDEKNTKSVEAKLERLKSRYARLGPLRIAPYLLGSLLCDLGTNIKRISEHRKAP
jgi:hypothetical protein